MSRLTVLPTPTQIFWGGQGSSSIINAGPSTVYLESNSSVSVGNGFPLPPLATMTWKGDRDLYAVTATGEARLVVNVSANISDTSRASVQRLIYANAAPGDGMMSEAFEVGSYETLLIRYFVTPVLDVTKFTFVFIWSDDDGNPIIQEDVRAWATLGVASMNVPIKGATCQVYATFADGTPYEGSLTDFKVYGTSRAYRFTASSYIPVRSASLPVANVVANRGSAYVTEFDYQEIQIPSWGNNLSVSLAINGSVTAAGEIAVVDMDNSNVSYGSLTIPTGTKVRTEASFIVPTGRPLRVRTVTAPTGGTAHYLTLVWSDYE